MKDWTKYIIIVL